MKKYIVNYTNLNDGGSSTIYIEANDLKEAKCLSQRHKRELVNSRLYSTHVRLYKG